MVLLIVQAKKVPGRLNMVLLTVQAKKVPGRLNMVLLIVQMKKVPFQEGSRCQVVVLQPQHGIVDRAGKESSILGRLGIVDCVDEESSRPRT